jgi:hypothetical protein
MSISANVSARESVMVPLARIPTDEGAQTRVRVRAAVVRDYATAMKQQRAEGNLRFPLGHAFVSRLRRESASVSGRQIGNRKVERSGTVYEMKVASRDRADAVTPPEILQPTASTDPLGIPLPESRSLVFTAHGDFRETQDLFDRLSCILDRIAQGPAGELYRQDMIRTQNAGLVCAAVHMGRNKLLAAEPYCCYCPNCHPTHPIRPYPACQKCGGRGWTTRAAFESCQTSAREHILRMRAQSA